MRNFLSKEHSKRKTQNILPPVKTYLVGKRHFLAGIFVIDRLVADALWNVVQSDVVAEIEEDTGNRYGNAGGEADVQRIEFLLDVPLVEILESDLAPNLTFIKSSAAVLIVCSEITSSSMK